MGNSSLRTGTFEWAVKTFNCRVGCEHNCLYCWARYKALKKGLIKSRDEWTNERPLPPPKKFRKYDGPVMFPGEHDITENNYPQCLDMLAGLLEVGNQVLIVTKPHYKVIKSLTTDLEAHKENIKFRFTIGSVIPVITKFWEPGAPTAEERLASLELAFDRGFKTSISAEPFLDVSIRRLVDISERFVTDTIWIGPMRKINQRVDFSTWSPPDMVYLDMAVSCYKMIYIKELYDDLNCHPKVRWKDEIQKMLGLKHKTEYGR